jgi:hypothetical protein
LDTIIDHPTGTKPEEANTGDTTNSLAEENPTDRLKKANTLLEKLQKVIKEDQINRMRNTVQNLDIDDAELRDMLQHFPTIQENMSK